MMPLLAAAQEKYRSGSFAEQLVTPAECLTIIKKPELQTMAKWSTLVYLSISQGALVKGEVKAGQVRYMQDNLSHGTLLYAGS